MKQNRSALREKNCLYGDSCTRDPRRCKGGMKTPCQYLHPALCECRKWDCKRPHVGIGHCARGRNCRNFLKGTCTNRHAYCECPNGKSCNNFHEKCDCRLIECQKYHDESCKLGRFCFAEDCSARHVICSCSDPKCVFDHNEGLEGLFCFNPFDNCRKQHFRRVDSPENLSIAEPLPALLVKEPTDEPAFTLICDSKLVANGAATILAERYPTFDESRAIIDSRLDVFVRVSDVEFKLYFPAVEWYEQHLKSASPDTYLDVARKWVNKMKSRRMGWSVPITDEYVDSVEETCFDGIDLHASRMLKYQECRYPEPKHRCVFDVQKANGLKSICNWRSSDDIEVDFQSDHWIVLARQDKEARPSRELLVFPRPKTWILKRALIPHVVLSDGSWRGHYTNLELSRMNFFWESLWNIQNEIEEDYKNGGGGGAAVEFFRLNFGRWESARSSDRQALECHGHAHIVLSADAQKVLMRQDKYQALRGRYGDLPPYDQDDALCLEQEVLLGEEVAAMHQEVKVLSENISTILSGQKVILDKLERFT